MTRRDGCARVKVLSDQGVELWAKPRLDGEVLQIELCLRGVSGVCMLHWGLVKADRSHERWRRPPSELWPEGTNPVGEAAVQTPFSDDGRLRLRFDPEQRRGRELAFVLYLTGCDRWLNRGGKDYRVSLAVESPRRDLLASLDRPLSAGEAVLTSRQVDFDAGSLAWRLCGQGASDNSDRCRRRLALVTDLASPRLYWGVAARLGEGWSLPPETQRPAGSEVCGVALETPFSPAGDRALAQLELVFEHDPPKGVAFVLRSGERWLKDGDKDLYISLEVPSRSPPLSADELDELKSTIVRVETEHSSWTLMHRFSLCRELLEQHGHDADALATLYCWLRFSALRQLDWQRHYNTKPRELAHAQDQLTQAIAEIYAREPALRPLARLALTTLGRGADGQRVRDEILEIMHRHKIKEATGHFMEEWHQKLHNNTTPDDVAICEAYLAFLRADGDLEVFYSTLATHGVTRQRLESYDRPIVTAPDFAPQLKAGLLHDFDAYLLTLKRVHEGADLQVAVESLHALPLKITRLLESIVESRGAHGDALLLSVARIVEARRRMSHLLITGPGDRDLLFCDVALENTLRLAIERDASARRPLRELLLLAAAALENLVLSAPTEVAEELRRALTHLHQLGSERATNDQAGQRDWALRAKAVVDRCARALGTLIDDLHDQLQPRAEALGQALGVERWTIELFAEEVLRGRPVFALSAMLRRLDGPLRETAELGDWQVVSPGEGRGVLQAVDSLCEVQRETFREQTVLVAQRVGGDEEIPPGVVSVLTRDSTDLVSHVAVRARNAGVLFATCYRDEVLQQLRELAGEQLRVASDPAGDIRWERVSSLAETKPHEVVPLATLELPPAPAFRGWTLGRDAFVRERVGGKAINVKQLVGALPNWIELPAAVALPFGCCEQTLGDERNRELAARYRRQVERLDRGGLVEGLAALRTLVRDLEPPAGLEAELSAAVEAAGMSWPEDFPRCFDRIKQVWASKWNERATLSREARGIPHERLVMAVLVQEIVPAELAFVLHTVNPLSGDRAELYGEIVVGLGETLVGNYPGRALGFVAAKDGSTPPRVIAYPSKSVALQGSGLIFRSDSNGEDLADYAGAGLYDSVPLTEARRVHVEYTAEPLLGDSRFRHELLRRLTELGALVEERFGAPQDIEGAYGDGRYHVVQTRPQVGLAARGRPGSLARG